MKITISKIKNYYINSWQHNAILFVLILLVLGGVYWFHTEDKRNNDVAFVFWNSPREFTFKITDIGELKQKSHDYHTYIALAFKNNKENLNDSVIYKKISYVEMFNYKKGQVLNIKTSYKNLSQNYDCKDLLNKMKPPYTTSQTALTVLGAIVVIGGFIIGCIATSSGADADEYGLIATGVVLLIISVGLFLGALLSIS